MKRTIVRGTSERRNGPMGYTDGVSRRAVVQNRTNFLCALGLLGGTLCRVEQVHGKNVFFVSKDHARRTPRADGMVTMEPGLWLGILTADCAPIFFWDAKKRAVGIAHAGWRGVEKGIAHAMVMELRKRGIKPADLRVAIGPAIQRCHFEIWPEAGRQWRASLRRAGHREFLLFLRRHRAVFLRRGILVERDGRVFFDIPGAIREELIRAGVARASIRASRACTAHLPKRFFSYRRKTAGGKDAFGNMLSVIGIIEKR